MQKAKTIFLLSLSMCLFGCLEDSHKNQFPPLAKSGETTIPAGEYEVHRDLVVPRGSQLKILAGARLKFGRAIKIVVKGSILIQGAADNPVVMQSLSKSSGGFWRGITIEGPSGLNLEEVLAKPNGGFMEVFENFENVIEHARIEDVRFREEYIAKRGNYEAAIAVENGNLKVRDLTFANIVWLNGIQAVSSRIRVEDSQLSSPLIHKNINLTLSAGLIRNNQMLQDFSAQKCNDGVWVIGSLGIIDKNVIRGKGDDGIQFKDSYGIARNNHISENREDGIKANHRSTVLLEGNKIIANQRYGVMASTDSHVSLKNNSIMNNKVGLYLRNRAKVLSVGDVFTPNMELDFLGEYSFSEDLGSVAAEFERISAVKSQDQNFVKTVTAAVEKMARQIQDRVELTGYRSWKKGKECSQFIIKDKKGIESKIKAVKSDGSVCSNIATLNSYRNSFLEAQRLSLQ